MIEMVKKTDAEDEAFFAHNYPSHRSQQSNHRGKAGQGRGKKQDKSASHPYTKCTCCNKSWHTAEICRYRIRDEAKTKEKEKTSTALPANIVTIAKMKKIKVYCHPQQTLLRGVQQTGMLIQERHNT